MMINKQMYKAVLWFPHAHTMYTQFIHGHAHIHMHTCMDTQKRKLKLTHHTNTQEGVRITFFLFYSKPISCCAHVSHLLDI